MSVLKEIFYLSNIIGIIAFALAGSFKAIKEELDLFGIVVIGVLSALGGGMIRDLFVGNIPLALKSFSNMVFALIGVFLAVLIFYVLKKDINKYLILVPDSIGLAAFSLSGFLIGYRYELSFFGVLILGTIAAVGGGAISDILMGKVPSVLKEDFYASCSIIGGAVFFILIKSSKDYYIASVSSFFVIILIRWLAIIKKWELPKLKV